MVSRKNLDLEGWVGWENRLIATFYKSTLTPWRSVVENILTWKDSNFTFYWKNKKVFSINIYYDWKSKEYLYNWIFDAKIKFISKRYTSKEILLKDVKKDMRKVGFDAFEDDKKITSELDETNSNLFAENKIQNKQNEWLDFENIWFEDDDVAVWIANLLYYLENGTKDITWKMKGYQYGDDISWYKVVFTNWNHKKLSKKVKLWKDVDWEKEENLWTEDWYIRLRNDIYNLQEQNPSVLFYYYRENDYIILVTEYPSQSGKKSIQESENQESEKPRVWFIRRVIDNIMWK